MSNEIKASAGEMVKNKHELDHQVNGLIETSKGNAQAINDLYYDSIAMLSLAQSKGQQLGNQKKVQRFFGKLTGKNDRIQQTLNTSLAAAQYCANQMLLKMAKQNLVTVDMVLDVDKRVKAFKLESNEEFKEVYLRMETFQSELEIILDGNHKRVKRLQDQFEYMQDKVRKMTMTCASCNSKLNENQYVCYKCGEIQERVDFGNRILPEGFNEKLKDLSKAASREDLSIEYLWDETVSKYAKTIQKTKNILSTEVMADKVNNNIIKNMDIMLSRCKSSELHIALVGTIKAGKSTLLNAILGSELTPANRVTPETASLTKFRASEGESYVNVTFYSSAEWQSLWKSVNDAKAEVFLEEYTTLKAESEKKQWVDQKALKIECQSVEQLKVEIEKWTSSKSASHYFVKEVEVGLKDFNMPKGVVFVDTPGLDDVVEYRSNITRDYIHRANAVLVCVKADSLSGQEMATIYSVFANTRYNPEKVYIVATQLDTLNRPEENWQTQREEWVKYLKRSDCFGTTELALKNIIPVSGYLYTLIKDFDQLSEDDNRYFDLGSILFKFRMRMEDLGVNERRLIDFTGVENLKVKLDKEVVDNYKTILIDDIHENYMICRAEIQELMTAIRQNQISLIETSEKGIDEIKLRRQELTDQLSEIATEKDQMENMLKTVRVASNERMAQLTSTIKGLGDEVMFPKLPGGIILDLAVKAYKWIKGKLDKTSEEASKEKALSSDSSVEDISRLNGYLEDFRLSVGKDVTPVINGVKSEISSYSEELIFALEGDKYLTINKTPINRFKRQIDRLLSNIDKTMDDEMSKAISLNNMACKQALQMVPGTKKEAALNDVLRMAIDSGIQAVVSQVEDVMHEMSEDFSDLYKGQIDQKEKDLEDQLNVIGNVDVNSSEQEAITSRIKHDAGIVIEVCDCLALDLEEVI